MPDTKQEVIDKLTKFRLVDKYQSFHEVMPYSFHADEAQRNTVTEVLDNCAKELLFLFKQAKKKPTKVNLKKVLQQHLTIISHLAVNESNKEFAYKLVWFLSEKVAVQLNKQSAKKYWGYWQVSDGEVQTVQYKKPRKKVQ